MKLTVNRKELQRVVDVAKYAVASRSPNPVLMCLYIEAKADALVVKGTNMTEFVKASTSVVTVDDVGYAIVSADTFSKCVSMLDGSEEAVSLESDGTQLVLTYGDGENKFPTQGASSLHEETTMEVVGKVTVEAEAFLDMLNKTVPFVGSGTKGWQTSCINISGRDNALSISGTDCRKSSSISATAKSIEGDNLSVNFGQDVATILLRMDPDADSTMEIQFGPSRVKFVCDSTEVTTTLLNYQYPPVGDVIRKGLQSTSKASVDRREILNLVKQLAIFTTDEHKAIRLAFSEGKVELDIPVSLIGQGRRSMEATMQGPDFSVCMAVPHFLTVLESCDADQLILHLNREAVAVVSEPDHYCMVMATEPARAAA